MDKMLNLLMVQGKKQVAQGILITALDKSYENLGLDKSTTNVLTQAILNAAPDL